MFYEIKNIFHRLGVVVLLLFGGICSGLMHAAEPNAPIRITLSGYVTDSITGERLEFITLQEKGTTNGTITNTDGAYQLLLRSNAKLVVSCIGYRTKEINTGSHTRKLNIQLCPSDFQLSEVVVKPKREHYRRRENPSVLLARNVIAHKHDNDLAEHDYYEATRLEQTTYSFNNFTGLLYKSWKKKFPDIDQYIDTAYSGSKVLPVSSDEKVETIHYRRNPATTKTLLKGQRHVGLDDMLPVDVVGKMQTECFPEIDLDEPSIYMFTNKFVNPVSKFAIAFYKFYILDTLTFDDGKRYIDLGFAPLVPEQFGFIGHLYVSTDSTYFLKKVEMNLPHDININFVRNMRFTLEQDRLADGTRVVTRKSFESEMNVVGETSGLYAQREVRYNGFVFGQPDAETEQHILNANAPYLEEPGLAHRNAEFWRTQNEAIGMVSRTDQVDFMLKEMRRKSPFLRYSEHVLTWLFKGYIATNNKIPIEQNSWLYGPITSTASYSDFEGLRLRTGGLTTAYLNPHWFASGWLAYGFKDQKFKGDARLEYSIKPKKNHFNEFPIHGFRLNYNYDTHILSNPTDNKDMFLLSVKRDDIEMTSYRRLAELTYFREFYGGFSWQLSGRWQREYATRLATFERVGSGIFDKYYDMTYGTLQLRYAPHETFIQNRQTRMAINYDHPVFVLKHSIGKKGVLGSDFDFQRTDFSFDKRFWLSAFGYVDVQLLAGKIWTQSPYAMLSIPYANTGYTIQNHSFALMNSMEFVADQYAQFEANYFLNGWLFNMVPLLKKLKWREVVSFRGYYGSLSDKNNPYLTELNPDLYRIPVAPDKQIYTEMDKGPYMEAAVGIENIFKILRIDYIRRINYLSNDNVTRNGIQITGHVTF